MHQKNNAEYRNKKCGIQQDIVRHAAINNNAECSKKKHDGNAAIYNTESSNKYYKMLQKIIQNG